jgi:hypothetical protein
VFKIKLALIYIVNGKAIGFTIYSIVINSKLSKKEFTVSFREGCIDYI